MAYLVGCTGTAGAIGPINKSQEIIYWSVGDTNWIDDDVIPYYKSHTDVFTILDGPVIFAMPAIPSMAYINFNANGESNMTVTINGVVYLKQAGANNPTGVWAGTTAGTCASGLVAALNGDTRKGKPPLTATLSINGNGVWLFWSLGGTTGNITVTTSSASACTVQSATGGVNNSIIKHVAITHTVNAQELLSGGIEIPLPITPLAFSLQVFSATGLLKAITDLVTVQTAPTRIRIATTGGTNCVATDVIRLITMG